MEEITLKKVHEDLFKLRKEVELVLGVLVSEGKLSEWAVRELHDARGEDEGKYTRLEDL